MERKDVLDKADEILNNNSEIKRVTIIVKNDDDTEIKAKAIREEE